MRSSKQLFGDILQDMRVKLADEFDRNFQRKAFFDRPWAPRQPRPKERGSLLLVSGKLRRSLKSHIRDTSVVFTSAMPYAAAHNEGVDGMLHVKAHRRRSYQATRLIRGKRGLRRARVTISAHLVRDHYMQQNLPARPFIGWHPRLGDYIRSIVKSQLESWMAEIKQEFESHNKH